MHTHVVDQFEFEHPDTEEQLEIRIARRSDFPFPDLRSFVAALRLIGSLPAPIPFRSLGGNRDEANYLKRFAAIDVPDQCQWRCYELPTDEDERWLLIEADDRFISYRWSTSA